MSDAPALVAVTGSTGRLGRAVVAALAREGIGTVALSRPEYDLDDSDSAATVIARHGPDVVINCAAWTAVDDCARDPDLAMRRNAQAVGELAAACAGARARLVHVSTNEVFDGERSDGEGYVETDEPRPINSYGSSKLAGEIAAREAFARHACDENLLIVRTAWLFGPPGNDFPTKMLAAADRLPAEQPLPVVVDEIGSPTYAPDLADAIVALVARSTFGGVRHIVNAGRAPRCEVAQTVFTACRPGRRTVGVSRSVFNRPSRPPAWAVLATNRAAGPGEPLRPWRDALGVYLASICS